jgi:hypothetical protein
VHHSGAGSTLPLVLAVLLALLVLMLAVQHLAH